MNDVEKMEMPIIISILATFFIVFIVDSINNPPGFHSITDRSAV